MAECITSRENGKVKYACKLAQSAAFRTGENAFFAEGLKLCLELRKGCLLKVIFYTQQALEKTPSLADLPCEQYLVEEHVAEKLAGVKSPQGVFGVFEKPAGDLSDMKRSGRLLALERVQDPGNVGALVRSAAAFGFGGILLSPGCADPFGPKALRASMGAAGRMPILAVPHLPDALAQLESEGVACLAAALYNSRPLSEAVGPWPNGLCVVIGSEGQGLSDEAIHACRETVRIPMTDRVESLNAGAAGSVLLWHFRGEGL